MVNKKPKKSKPKATKPQEKRFIIKKYIMAVSAKDALKKERKVIPDDVCVDEDWKKDNPNQLQSAIGYVTEEEYD